MVNIQRTKNDDATDNRREIADRIMENNRFRNDKLTAEKRLRADAVREDKRFRNDELTTNRRKMNDRNPWKTIAISLLLLAALAIGAYLIFR